MSFKILLLAPDVDPSWPEKIRRAVPGVVVKAFVDPKDAEEDIVDADAAYGTVLPELLARAAKLRWICADRAGLGGAWFYDELVKRDVVVTSMRGSYNEHLAGHAVAFRDQGFRAPRRGCHRHQGVRPDASRPQRRRAFAQSHLHRDRQQPAPARYGLCRSLSNA